jgi:sensor c-di-GMP phosphodiesterase-like protein
MADSLNLDVIVEGIETDEQASYFTASGRAIHAQGWLYGRPVPPAEFHHLLEDDAQKIPPSEEPK